MGLILQGDTVHSCVIKILLPIMTLADPDHLQALEQLHWSHCHCSTQTKRVLETFIDICVDECSLFTAPGAPDKHKTDKLQLDYCCGTYFLW